MMRVRQSGRTHQSDRAVDKASGTAAKHRSDVIMASSIPPYGLRGAALAFPICAGRHSSHDNGRCSDRNRCLPAGRLLLRSVAALRGQPEVSEGTGQRCRERCMESTQEPSADRSCHRGRVLPVEPPGALTRIKVRSCCWWAGWPLGTVARAGLAVGRLSLAGRSPPIPPGIRSIRVPGGKAADDGHLRQILRSRRVSHATR